MKTLEIFYSDLNEEAAVAFDEVFGPEEDFNHETMPLFIYEVEDDE